MEKELERISALEINPEPIIDLELESKNRGRYPKLQEYNYNYNLNGFCDINTRLFVEIPGDRPDINTSLYWPPGSVIRIKFLNDTNPEFPVTGINCKNAHFPNCVPGPKDPLQARFEQENIGITENPEEYADVIGCIKRIIRRRFEPILNLNFVYIEESSAASSSVINEDAEVRISFNPYGITETRLGTSCLEVLDQTRHTTTFGWFDVGTFLHVFCQILGMGNDMVGDWQEDPLVDIETEIEYGNAVIAHNIANPGNRFSNPHGKSSLVRGGGATTFFPILDQVMAYNLFIKPETQYNKDWVDTYVLSPPIMYHNRDKAIGGFRKYQDPETIMAYYIPEILLKSYTLDRTLYQQIGISEEQILEKESELESARFELNRRLSLLDIKFLMWKYPKEVDFTAEEFYEFIISPPIVRENFVTNSKDYYNIEPNFQYSTLATYNWSSFLGNVPPVPATTVTGFYIVPDYKSIKYDSLTSTNPSCTGYRNIQSAYGADAANCDQKYLRKSCSK